MIFLLTVTCRSGTAGDRELTGHAHTNLNIFAANSMECEGWVTAWEFYVVLGSTGCEFNPCYDYFFNLLTEFGKLLTKKVHPKDEWLHSRDSSSGKISVAVRVLQ